MEDSKEVFDYFAKYQEQSRACRLYNAFTGRNRSKQSFTRDLWIYIISHESETRPVIKDILGERGIVLTDTMWKSYQYTKARVMIASNVSRNKFYREVGIEESFVPVETPNL